MSEKTGGGPSARSARPGIGPGTWRHILDAVDDPVFVHDDHYRLLLANQAYCTLAGVSEAEVVGTVYWEVFPPGHGPLPGCRASTHGATGPTSPEEVIVGARCFSSVGYTVPDDEGRPSCFLHVLTDISERRRAEAALRQSEARHRDVVESAQDAIISVDGKTGVITAANPAAETIFGYTRSEMLGQNLHALLMPERFRPVFEKAMPAFAKTGKGAAVGRTLELTALHKDGSEFPIELSLSATYLDGTWHATGIARDVSERKRAEALQRDLAAKYSAMFESSSDAILLLDGDAVINCNASAVRMFGGAVADDLAGLHLFGLSPPTQPGGEASDSLRHRVTAGALAQGSLQFEWRHRRLDGSEFFADVLLTALEVDGKRLLQATVRDTTEVRELTMRLKQSEQRYRHIAEATSDWAWQTDENGVYVYVSRKITDILGYTPEEVCGRTPFDLMPPDEATRVAEIFADLSSAKLPFSFLENIAVHKDGRQVILETSGVPVLDDGGELRGYFGVEHDITRRRQLEEKVRESETQYRVVFEQAADVTYLLDREGRIKSLSPSFKALTGWSPRTWEGEPLAPLIHPDDLPRAMEVFLAACAGTASPVFELRLSRKSGGYVDAEISMVPVDLRDGTAVIGIGRDVSARKREEERIRFFATTDELTGLTNRREFSASLAREAERARRFASPLSLIMCDIDHFKRVNDTFGHDAGDRVLRGVGALMRRNTRSVDVVARWGGEEFMVLLPQSDREAAGIVAEKLRALVAGIRFRKIGRVTLSFGVTAYAAPEDVDTLIKRADGALYAAKNKGRNRVEVTA